MIYQHYITSVNFCQDDFNDLLDIFGDFNITIRVRDSFCHTFIAAVTEIKDRNGGLKHLYTKRAAIRESFGLPPFGYICQHLKRF